MKNKGFTLIELLAVILILGIIALIAIPTVTSVVEESRRGAFENTVNNLEKELGNECMENLLSGGSGRIKITFNDGVSSPSINMKGNMPDEGYAITNEGCKVRIVVSNSSYYVEKDFEELVEVKKVSDKRTLTTNKEILLSQLTTTPNLADYSNLKAGANAKNSIIVKVHAYGKTYTAAGDTFEDATKTHKWLISVHGYSMNEMNVPAEQFVNMGYNVVVPRMYYWGNGSSSMNEDITWGWTDRYDVHDVINYIISVDPDAQIVLFGGSMGAATVASLSGDILPSNVKAIIEDSGYVSLDDEINFLVNVEDKTNIKSLSPEYADSIDYMSPSELRQTIVNIFSTSLPSEYKIGDISALNQVKNAVVPMLFMHGSEDTLVDPESVNKFYEAATLVPTKEVFVTEGACHTCASYISEYTTSFYNKIKTFLNSIGM